MMKICLVKIHLDKTTWQVTFCNASRLAGGLNCTLTPLQQMLGSMGTPQLNSKIDASVSVATIALMVSLISTAEDVIVLSIIFLTMNLQDYSKIYQHNGVVKINKLFKRSVIDVLKQEDEQIVAIRNTSHIYRDEPLVVLWTHVPGAGKKTCKLSELPSFKHLIYSKIAPFIGNFLNIGRNEKIPFLQLLEVIVFNKLPAISNTLNWHQDVAYFPVKPNNQVAVWFPLADVTSEMGPMVYAHGSYKMGIRGSTNLHTREPFEGEDRELIPLNPEDDGLTVEEYPLTQEDILIHDGYTWHYSKPNRSLDKQ